MRAASLRVGARQSTGMVILCHAQREGVIYSVTRSGRG
jgi:hypothetical protein